MAQIYKARRGARFRDSDAALIGRELDKIGFDGQPSTFVAAARPPSSPLHDYFIWDNDQAAELHRLSQARYLLRFIDIVIVTENGEEQTRGYHQVVIQQDDGSARRYIRSVEIAGNADLESQVIAKALQELRGWRERYAEYQHIFGDIFAVIDRGRRPRRKKKAIA